MATRALVSTIPKCGKNLIISFFDALGLNRQFDERAVVTTAAYVQARWLLDARAQGLQPQPAFATAEIEAFLAEVRPSFEALVGSLATLADGTYTQGHFGYDPELHASARAAGVPIVFVYRDPRGCLASMAHFLIERGEPADLLPRLERRDFQTALRFLLGGDDSTLPFDQLLASYAGWIGAEGVLALRFEDLVGARGGGSDGRQLAALTALVRHIGWQGPTSELLRAVEQTFNPQAGTFRRGRIDGWRDDVGPCFFERYPAALVDLPRAWGYTDEPEPAGAALVESGLLALIDSLRAEQAAGEAARAVTEQDNVERVAVIRDLDARLATIRAGYDHLVADNAERLGTIERAEALTAQFRAAYEVQVADNEQRLTAITDLTVRLTALQTAYEALAADGAERLAVIKRTEARAAEMRAAYDAQVADNERRLAIIRDLTVRLTALQTAYEALGAEHATLTDEHQVSTAAHQALLAEHRASMAEHAALKAAHESLAVTHESLAVAHVALKAAHESLAADHVALKTDHESLAADHVALKAAHAALVADHAKRRAALDTLRRHPVVRLLRPRPDLPSL